MLTGCGKPATRPCFKLGVPALFVILFIVLVCHPALPQARILTPIDDTQLVSLQGNTNPLVQPANDQGPVEDNFPASRMILLLRRSPDREAALQDFLQAVQNPASPQFHRYLTPQQFGRQFGLDERDTDSV